LHREHPIPTSSPLTTLPPKPLRHLRGSPFISFANRSILISSIASLLITSHHITSHQRSWLGLRFPPRLEPLTDIDTSKTCNSTSPASSWPPITSWRSAGIPLKSSTT
jgi:hypothetical protein